MKHSSRPQREILPRECVEQDRSSANDRLMKDYFDEAPTYPNPNDLGHRFRMSKRLFLRIAGDMENKFDYFKQKADASGMLGFTAIQKCTSALQVLAYGNTIDITDEYLKMANKKTRDILEHFCHGISASNNKERVNNAHEMRFEAAHSALAVDLVQHPWSVRYIPNEGEEEVDDEEDEDGEYGENEYDI
ncbi:uncharacterized protein LOC110880750 [Helianthus annuus]|uniref:uncharacterized protein LOC110880750 n=1 Tax=Helianthus annuus TaxID=4232 RepID=UPI000B8FAE8B|nr:uncharacterized protein LOC110880750 [Helianthus annuus]